MTEMINGIGNRMVALAKVCNIARREWSQDERRFTEIRESDKFDWEFNGMRMAMDAMGIKYDFEFDDNVVEMTAIIIMGTRFEV